MSLSNLQYLYDHLPAHYRREDDDLFLKRFLSFFGEEADGFDEQLDTFYQKIDPATAPEEFLDWWLYSLFGWAWFPTWFRLEQKRNFYRDVAKHYARRGTKGGIEEFLNAFGVKARVVNKPQYWGEFTWGDDPLAVTGPLGLIVQVSPELAAQPSDLSFWGEFTWGESLLATPANNIQRADVEALLRFQWPVAQTIMLEYLSYELPRSLLAGFFHTQSLYDVSFDAAPSETSGLIVAYSWDFGDASEIRHGSYITHRYAGPGAYNVTLTVTDDRGAINSLTQTIIVADPTIPSADIPGVQGAPDFGQDFGR